MARTPGAPSLSGADFLAEARKFLGDLYVYGGAGPTTFDCSGLVQYALRQIGLENVPRTSEEQWAWTQKIGRADLQPGDLVFSQWPGDDAPPGHVAIYAGDGQLLEAPRPGESIHITPLSANYQKYVYGYGRVPGLSAGGTAPAGGGSPGITQAGLSSIFGDWLGTLLTGGGADPLTALAGILGTVLGPISNTFSDFDHALSNAMHGVLWLVNPRNWLRIISGIAGAAAAITGAVLIAGAA